MPASSQTPTHNVRTARVRSFDTNADGTLDFKSTSSLCTSHPGKTMNGVGLCPVRRGRDGTISKIKS
ncbi:hypothetical protein FQN60_004207 [Etheostoma spectabile]|uniref:Uncharacterized protein n=1 Tax=Etheostoma spectabile TaxID=54343 RepID=A0A5J5CX90_9PERO|nr:hypothetical protein FQN60_004207 [Etheostoma spectabile]